MAAPRHRATARPRYGRLTALGASLAVVVVSLLASAGALPGADENPALAGADVGEAADVPTPTPTPTSTPTPAPAAGTPATVAAAPDPEALPGGSGSGRRIVFDQSAQRVWLVEDGEEVARTYLVSGSVTDNLHPGTYSVYSRSRWAVGVDDSGVMEYFVRFTRGAEGAAIGFHTIPTKDGTPLQRRSQLGTPQSHGCIRQRTSDARALWDFAPEGTTVVVVA